MKQVCSWFRTRAFETRSDEEEARTGESCLEEESDAWLQRVLARHGISLNDFDTHCDSMCEVMNDSEGLRRCSG